MNAPSENPPPPRSCPAHSSGERIPLYGPEFAADPQSYYQYLRQFGPSAPIELAPGVDATLVTEHTAALQLLQDSVYFRKDARRWRDHNEGRIRADSPVLPLLAFRPNCMFTDGADHLRLRQAVTDSLARVNSRRLSHSTGRASDYLITRFGSSGSVDLLRDYAKQLPLLVFNELFGCPGDIGDRVLSGISGIFDGINAEEANAVLVQAVGELVTLKRSSPGEDVTSWLMQHAAELTHEEMVHQLVLLLGAGAEPLGNLIGNTLHRLLTDDRYAKGGLIEEAIEDTLWDSPPISNYAPHYPVADMEFAGRKLSAGDLVLVSFAAANTGPTLSMSRQSGNRAHLAWSAGPHACPSKEPARLITVTAIENLLNRVPDLELAVPQDSLTWRPGPFNRALSALPASFTPLSTTRVASMPAEVGGTAHRVQSRESNKSQRQGAWSAFLSWWKG